MRVYLQIISLGESWKTNNLTQSHLESESKIEGTRLEFDPPTSHFLDKNVTPDAVFAQNLEKYIPRVNR